VLVQLSGVPGSGKSTLARGLAAELGVVVLDTDVLKSALLARGMAMTAAGPATYAAVLALAGDLLKQRHDVLIDSPCRYDELLRDGQSTAAAAGASYRFIELWADDPADLLTRLDRRRPRPSQIASGTEPVPGTSWELGTPVETLRGWQEQLVRPALDWVRIDALAGPAEALGTALAYLGGESRG
jgi:predicted kinase